MGCWYLPATRSASVSTSRSGNAGRCAMCRRRRCRLISRAIRASIAATRFRRGRRRPVAASAQSGQRLRQNSLGLPQIIASTLANIAPAMSFYFGFGVIVAGAGVGAPLTILLAMLVVLFLTNTLAEFSRYRPSTGSFVTFIGMAFGPAAGAAASIVVTVGYCIAAASAVVISGGWAHSTWLQFVGGDIPWQALS